MRIHSQMLGRLQTIHRCTRPPLSLDEIWEYFYSYIAKLLPACLKFDHTRTWPGRDARLRESSYKPFLERFGFCHCTCTGFQNVKHFIFTAKCARQASLVVIWESIMEPFLRGVVMFWSESVGHLCAVQSGPKPWHIRWKIRLRCVINRLNWIKLVLKTKCRMLMKRTSVYFIFVILIYHSHPTPWFCVIFVFLKSLLHTKRMRLLVYVAFIVKLYSAAALYAIDVDETYQRSCEYYPWLFGLRGRNDLCPYSDSPRSGEPNCSYWLLRYQGRHHPSAKARLKMPRKRLFRVFPSQIQ